MGTGNEFQVPIPVPYRLKCERYATLSTTNQGGAGGTRKPGGAGGLMGHSGDEGARSRWHNPPSHAQLLALAPGLASQDRAPGRSSVLSLSLAMAHWSRRALALRQRWAQALAPRSGVNVGWSLSPEWGWCGRL